MATTSQPSTGLLAVGHQCSAQYCNLVDFLPFKCQHCEQKFCGEHYLPASHNCGKYDELKHNRVAPSCESLTMPAFPSFVADFCRIGPLCNIPVTVPLGQDPNIRMDRHIASECSVTTGKATQSTQPHCANPRCKKLLFAPIRCDVCFLDLPYSITNAHRWYRNAVRSSVSDTGSQPITLARPAWQRNLHRNRS